ncbi:ankyrin repeat-containing domain protein [Xylaria sp. FL1777]|nr:ankyrin repeat-containing domain protein [Xylaria sp. FL1777]
MPSDDWEQHRELIQNLYIKEKKPLIDVISCMKRNHNFAKTKSQYHYQFQKWGMRKYVKKEDWKYLDSQLKRRAGKQTEVTRFGMLISPERVRKETQRYRSIPTANQFGNNVPSPKTPDGIVVRAQTPIIIEDITWPPLPWFDFKNTVLRTLRDPCGLLRTTFTTFGSELFIFKYEGQSSSVSLYEISRNPVEFSKTVLQLTNSIPDDNINPFERQGAQDLARKDSSLSIPTEVLKLIFFRLSNNMFFLGKGNIDEYQLQAHDQFVLHFVEAVSRTNPDMLSQTLRGHCITTEAIQKAIYGSAIREKHYTILSQLLASDIDPNLPTFSFTHFGTKRIIKRGMLHLSHGEEEYVHPWKLPWTGMKEAAYMCDTRLGRMLLNAKAHLGDDFHIILQIIGYRIGSTENSGSTLEFMQLLAEYGVLDDHSALFYPCQCSRLILLIAISIAESDNHTAEFLIEKEASMWQSQYSEYQCCSCSNSEFLRGFEGIVIGYRPLHVAIVSGNEEWIRRLLLPVISDHTQVPVHVIQEALLISCLAGDVDTASKILNRHPSVVASNVRSMEIKPLAATAWNRENTTIARRLLELGADIGPTRNAGIKETPIPAPIHVAAYHGNTGLVQQLLAQGVDCNVKFCFPFYESTNSVLDLLNLETALQFALKGERVEIVKLLLPHSKLVGGELILAIRLRDDSLISEFVSRGVDINRLDRYGEEILEAAVETGNKAIISFYFSEGGSYTSEALWKATEAAIESEDHSIVRLLASHRPASKIDQFEASSLALSIKRREWDLVFFLLQDPFISGPVIPEYVDDELWFLTPLWAAFMSENQSVVDVMVQRGYVPQWCDMRRLMEVANEPIRQAFWRRFPLETMDLPCRRALLLHAIKSGNTQKVREYIKLVGCLDFPCRPYMETGYRKEQCPLHLAILTGNTELVRLLLLAGADVEFVDVDLSFHEKSTALQSAVLNGHLHVVSLLLEYEARVNPPGQLRSGGTALQYSAIGGHLKMAQLLLSRGADIDAPPAQYYGRTALEGASEHGRLDMVNFLLEKGAKLDGDMRIHYIRSIYFAKKEGHYAIARHLTEYGSWGERDQVLQDRHCHQIDSSGYFRYEEEIDDWSFRKMKIRLDGDQYSVGSYSSSSRSSSEIYASDDESEGEESNERDNDKMHGASYETDCIPQTWWDGMDPTMAESSGFSNTGEQVVDGLVLSQKMTSQRVIEVDDIVEAGTEQFDVSNNVASRRSDELTANQPELCEQRSNLQEGIPELEMNDYVPEMNLPGGQDVALNGAEIVLEDPFFRVDETEAVDYTNGQLEIWRQRNIVGEGEFDYEVDNYAQGNDPMDEQITTLDATEEGWEGPFSNFDGFADLDDGIGVFPFHS